MAHGCLLSGTVQELAHAPAREILRFDGVGKFHGHPVRQVRFHAVETFGKRPCASSSSMVFGMTHLFIVRVGPRSSSMYSVTTNDPLFQVPFTVTVYRPYPLYGREDRSIFMTCLKYRYKTTTSVLYVRLRLEHLLVAFHRHANVPVMDGSSDVVIYTLAQILPASAVQHLSRQLELLHPVLGNDDAAGCLNDVVHDVLSVVVDNIILTHYGRSFQYLYRCKIFRGTLFTYSTV